MKKIHEAIVDAVAILIGLAASLLLVGGLVMGVVMVVNGIGYMIHPGEMSAWDLIPRYIIEGAAIVCGIGMCGFCGFGIFKIVQFAIDESYLRRNGK